jgi:predicted homoserine dehydrogenase-like protein
VAKRDLWRGEVLDGEGGALVWGKCIPAARARSLGSVPIGLAHGVALARDVPMGAILTNEDLDAVLSGDAAAIRAEMVARCG